LGIDLFNAPSYSSGGDSPIESTFSCFNYNIRNARIEDHEEKEENQEATLATWMARMDFVA
jgi:hypothetical protein